MKILIIDSGVESDHPRFERMIFHRLTDDITDHNGHGTAIAGIIASHNESEELYIYKLFDEAEKCTPEKLLEALLFLLTLDETFDIINMSFGITAFEDSSMQEAIEQACKELSQNGSIIVSAFDNDGAISYPAAFECVIGVDSSYKVYAKNEYEYVENSFVSARAYGRIQRVCWKGKSYTIVEGNSFACANMTNIIADYLRCASFLRLDQYLMEHAIQIRKGKTETPLESPAWLAGSRAIVFPFNKEIQTMIANENLCTFEIQNVFDFKRSFNVGSWTDQRIQYAAPGHHLIWEYDSIDWNSSEFDTVIAGHLYEISNFYKKDLLRDVIQKCTQYGKALFAFDDLSAYNVHNLIACYYPILKKNIVPSNRFGKLHDICCPVAAVIGTGSNQGKFSLQLSLKKKLQEQGYCVGHIGTEPSALCLGADYCFPCGYRSSNQLNDEESVQVLNEMIYQTEKKGADLILAGTQAGTVSYFSGNLMYLPLKQYVFLSGIQPDAVILVVNPYDEIEYIERSIHAVEGNFRAKCVAIVLYHKVNKPLAGNLFQQADILDISTIENKKDMLRKQCNIPVVTMKEAAEKEDLIEILLDYFAG